MSRAPEPIVTAKRRLRADIEAARNGVPEPERQAAAARVAAIGIAKCGAVPGRIVSAFASMGSEIDTFPLLHRLAADGYRTCLPVITPLGQPLIFRAWAPGDPLVPRKWGIREPADTAPVVEPDVLLVPLLAFDSRGGRLGYGGGYFDRTIARLRTTKPVVTIGLALAMQEVAEIPCEDHDQRLDFVLTETGLTRLGATRTGL